VDRGEPERRSITFVGERLGGLLRVGGQADCRDQPGKCLFVDLVPDAERIDMIGGDTEQTGDAA
jgi:hypothetical protein